MIRPIKMCCTPILPTAYADSLSYYEEICKLTEKMNEIIADINDNLTNYISNNFNNIMIDSIYDEDNERIVLSKEIIVTSDTHSYSSETKTIKVG
jgi:hypothetical protein